MSVDNRDLYNLKKIQRFNNVDQKYNNNNNLQELKPQKIEKTNVNLDKLVQERKSYNQTELDESIKKRTNLPYKGIIKNFDFTKIRATHKEDLVVHKVTEADKKTFNDELDKFACVTLYVYLILYTLFYKSFREFSITITGLCLIAYCFYIVTKNHIRAINNRGIKNWKYQKPHIAMHIVAMLIGIYVAII